MCDVYIKRMALAGAATPPLSLSHSTIKRARKIYTSSRREETHKKKSPKISTVCFAAKEGQKINFGCFFFFCFEKSKKERALFRNREIKTRRDARALKNKRVALLHRRAFTRTLKKKRSREDRHTKKNRARGQYESTGR